MQVLAAPCRDVIRMNIKSQIFSILLCYIFVVSSLSGQTTLFFDDFSGSSADGLNGTTPDIAPDGITWNAAGIFKADGSVTAIANQGAYLSLGSGLQENFIYELSADIANTSDSWIALGFVQSASSTVRHTDSTVNGIAWLLTSSSSQQVFQGPRATNNLYQGSAVADPTALNNYKITLNTDDANAVLLSVDLAGTTVISNQDIGALSSLNIGGFGVSARNPAVGSIDNLRLTAAAIPEPATYGFFIGGSVLLCAIIYRLLQS